MKRLVSVLIAAMLLVGLFASAAAATTGEKVYRTYMSADCPTLNAHDSVESTLQTPYDYCSSPLFRRVPSEDRMGFKFIGDLASELPIKIDDYNWQIKLRPEAKWQNGDPIIADTIMYSFKMQIDPILINQMGSYLASNNIKILNATEYMKQGTAATVAWEDVGIKKIDDYTIQITTVDKNTANDVCTHFVDRSTFPVYEPMYEGGMNADRTETTYGTTLEKWMGIGPYKFDSWIQDSIQVYVKNPDHWLADLFHYDRVEVRIIPEMNARVELWEKGELDDLIPNADVIETYIDDPRMAEYLSVTVYHIDVNCKNPNNPLSPSVNYRKALYHAMNREVIARNLFGYMQPTGTYISGQAGIFSENGLTFRDSDQGKAVSALVESWGPYGYSPELALDYFNKACEEMNVGKDVVVPLIVQVSESDSSATYWRRVAEYLQQELPKIFENRVSVEIVSTPLSQTEHKKTGDDKWDLSPNDWSRGASRTYPHQALYFFTSQYSSAPNNFFDAGFDDQFAVCEQPDVKEDYAKLLEETKKLEEIFLDKVIQIPVVQNITYQLLSDRLELKLDRYVPGLGWGTIYADIKQ